MKPPIELLREKLEELKRARDKSQASWLKGQISEELYDSHIVNLTPMIEEYKRAIRVLEMYM